MLIITIFPTKVLHSKGALPYTKNTPKIIGNTSYLGHYDKACEESQLGGTNMPPKWCFFLFEGMGAWFPVKFPTNSNQIPLGPINNPSKSFCSHQLLIKFVLFPTQLYINLHKVLNFGIKSFTSQLASLHIFFFWSHNMAYPTIAHVGIWFIFSIFELPTINVL